MIQTRRARRKTQPQVQVAVYQRVETRLGFIHWNPDKLGVSILLALVGAFLGLLAGGCVGTILLSPLACSFFSMACALLGAISAGTLVLTEGFSLGRS